MKSIYLSRTGTVNESMYGSHSGSQRSKRQPIGTNRSSITADADIIAKLGYEDSRRVSRQSSTRSDRSVGRQYQGRNSFHNEPIPEHGVSEPSTSALVRQHSGDSLAHGNNEGIPAINRQLRSSGSTSSLTRSQSVILEPKIRHSPGCKKYNNL